MKSGIAPRKATRFESRSFLVGLVLTGLLSILWFVPAMRVFELKMLDFLFTLKGRPVPDSRVVHVDIDDSSIEKIGRWPWDRIRHAQLVDVLTEAGARAIVFDITFPDPQSRDNDDAFISSCAVSDRVYLAFNLQILPESAFSAQALPWYNRAKKELLSDITLGPGELAVRLGLEVKEVERYATRVKEVVIEEELRRRMDQQKDFDIDAFVSLLCPGGFEERVARRTFDRLEAEHFLPESPLTLQASGLTAPGPTALAPPLSGLARAAKGCGFVSVEPDPHDGVLRHIPLLRPYHSNMYSYLALAVLRDIEGFEIRTAPGEIVLTRDSGELRIPVNERNEVLLDWTGVSDFQRLPFAAVIQIADMREAALRNLCQEALTSKGLSKKLLEALAKLSELTRTAAASPDPKAHRQAIIEQRETCAKEREILLSQIERLVDSAKSRGVKGDKKRQVDAFEHLTKATRKLLARADELTRKLRGMVAGKIIIIGSTHTGSTDLHPTPIGAEIPGCMAHSTLMSMFSARSFPREPWRWSSLVLLIAGGLGISLASSRLSALRSVFVTIAAVLGLSLALTILFASTGIFLGAAGPLAAMAVSFAGTTAYRRFAEERARRRIRSIFQRQVGESVAQQLIRGSEKVELGGELRTATVYFSDIGGFSSISEKLTPPQLVEMLNEYFTLMCMPVVETYAGFLDKFEGDAILAVFGVPLAVENHARDACYAALENQQALAELRSRVAERSTPEIYQRIGISTGEMVVGYFGSPQRHDYTVMGDAVNIGQRLEAANKLYGTSIIIGKPTYEMAKEFIEVRELDLARVPGRVAPVRLFELAAKKGALPQGKRSAFSIFAEALRFYRGRDFVKALELFGKVADALPGDGPSTLYMTRCREHISSPPAADWDGIHDIGLK